MLKLNLGCGEDVKKGYINIDTRPFPGVLVADVQELPVKDNSVDEILALDIYEHVSHLESQKLLNHWVSKLKKRALLFVQAPCLDRIIEYLLGAKDLKMIEMGIACIFGGQDYPENFHKTICHSQLMIDYLRRAGIKGNIDYQLDGTNIKFKAIK